MSAILLSALLLLPPDEKGASLTHATIAAYIASSFADLATTMHCLGAKTCHEANPALRPLEQSPLAFGFVKGAASAAIAWVLLRLHRRYPWPVRLTASALAVGSTYIAVRNTRTAR